MSEFDKTGVAGAVGADGFGEGEFEWVEEGAGAVGGQGAGDRERELAREGGAFAGVSGSGADESIRERSGCAYIGLTSGGRRSLLRQRAGTAFVHAVGSGGDFTGRLVINTTEITRAGTPLPASTPSDSLHLHHLSGNDGKLFLEIVSTDLSDQTITIWPNSALLFDGLGIEPLVLVIPASTASYYGTFAPNTFNQDLVENEVWIDPSVSGTLLLRAYRLDAAVPY